MIVAALAAGRSLDDACRAAMADVCSLDTDGLEPMMSLVALSAGGTTTGFSTTEGTTYVAWEDGMASADERSREIYVG
jgi:hypothetical protein